MYDENVCIGGTDFQVQKGKESSSHELLHDQLYSESLLWCGEQELMNLHMIRGGGGMLGTILFLPLSNYGGD